MCAHQMAGSSMADNFSMDGGQGLYKKPDEEKKEVFACTHTHTHTHTHIHTHTHSLTHAHKEPDEEKEEAFARTHAPHKRNNTRRDC